VRDARVVRSHRFLRHNDDGWFVIALDEPALADVTAASHVRASVGQHLERRRVMQALQERMKNPVVVLPEALQAMLALGKAADQAGVPPRTIALVHLRASQINGCSVCIDMHWRQARKLDETDERLFALAGWRDAPYFTAAERAALALTEAATRIADRADPVPDDVWQEAARHYDERALAGLVLHIALINAFNRVNVTTRQIAGKLPR
jgi:AhpD family alkylhydroperoxidase